MTIAVRQKMSQITFATRERLYILQRQIDRQLRHIAAERKRAEGAAVAGLVPCDQAARAIAQADVDARLLEEQAAKIRRQIEIAERGIRPIPEDDRPLSDAEALLAASLAEKRADELDARVAKLGTL
ncbi:MAG: hypothetical protein WC732_09765 [Candidatus Omnitrophota bacterium]